jgi:hypothetical protein
MNNRSLLRLVVLAVTVAASSLAIANTTAGAASVMVIPIAAQTASYSTEVFVRNPQTVPITLNVKFYEAKTAAIPGLRPCSQFSLLAGQSLSFQLGSQCTLGAGNHHGLLILEDAAAEKINFFYAYSRSQTPGGNGFSVEGYPIGVFSGQAAGHGALKRQAAAPTYQTNCFVAALGEAVNYSIQLRDGATNTNIGNPVAGTLQPYEMERHLDIMAVAGLPAGDYSNVRAVFTQTPNNNPAYVAFCTVQESTFFGADFRLAGTTDAQDVRQFRTVCYGQSPCGTLNSPGQLNPVTSKNIHWTIITSPDYFKCELVGPNVAELEMQIRGPGDTFLAPIWPSAPPYSSGGSDQTSFYIYTGPRNAVNSGTATRWYIDVELRQSSVLTAPVDYGITCTSGNGMSFPWFRGNAARDF